MSLDTCIEFIQQEQLIETLNKEENQPEIMNTYMIKKIALKCKYCKYEQNRKMPGVDSDM